MGAPGGFCAGGGDIPRRSLRGLYFLEAGGERYEYIAALNADDAHIQVLTTLLESNLQGWDMSSENTVKRNELAKAIGAEK